MRDSDIRKQLLALGHIKPAFEVGAREALTKTAAKKLRSKQRQLVSSVSTNKKEKK